ncbi:MAG TPA: isocitrate lyase/phosphoenolpyruvate mutase family protein [Candidatus Eisenbacteria bacterium]|nr:isocitrate lyase/phosphoenolpyruvate mutase family protein [Candidatus Eisenbacteria bacterium]
MTDPEIQRPSPSEKGARFRALHQGPGVFVIANAWDPGSARLLAQLGFQAVATSSAAAARALGLEDGQLGRDRSLANARSIVDACDLPVSADLEDGFGEAPAVAAETIRMAGAAGLAGASIEDAPAGAGVDELSLATERIAAAVEAARSLSVPFTLTARCENFVRGRPDLDDTIERLRAYERAGADVLFAPGLPTLDAVRTVCSAVAKPVNFMAGIPGKSFSLPELEAAGVRRVSLAASLHRAAMAALRDAAEEVLNRGTFTYIDRLAALAATWERAR